MRAPTINFTSSLLSSLNRNNVQLNKLMDQFTQQKRVVNPSDDPLASTRLAQLNRDLAATKQYQTNIDRLSSSLLQQEVQVEGISNQLLTLMDKLREANNSTLSPEDMGGYATEITSMMDTMISQLNSRDESGRYMFGGTITNQVPVVQDASGQWVYQGNRDGINTVVGNGVEIRSNTDLTAVFGNDLATLNRLQDLAAKMADPANDPADYLDDISAALASVQTSSDRTAALFTDLGGRQNNLSLLKEAHIDNKFINDEIVNDLQAMDMPEVVLKLTQYTQVTQASYKMYSQISSLSLFTLG